MEKANIYSNKKFYNLIFVDLILMDKDVVALFDTGASKSIIAESLACDLGFMVKDSVTAKNNQGKSIKLKKTIIPRLSIGKCQLSKLECLVAENSLFNIESEDGKAFPAKMILGWDVIKDFYWKCNMVERKIYIDLAGKAPASDSLAYDGFPLIKASFKNRRLKAGLDMGHTDTMISSRLNGLDFSEYTETELVALGTRSKVKVRICPDFKVSINKQVISLKNLEVFPEIHGGKDLDVLFGLDLLEGHSWIMDYKSKYFKIEKYS